MVRCIVLVAMTAMVLSGCGAMFTGTSQTIDIQSTPSGATVMGAQGIGTLTTPTKVTLSKKQSYDLVFSKEGYKDAMVGIQAKVNGGTVLLDILFTGLIGIVVDASTGGWNSLKPETVIAVLDKKENASIEGPDQIIVRVDAQGDQVSVESDEPVGVSINIDQEH